MTESIGAMAYGLETLLAQNPVGPMGADFGKASPIGLLIIVILLVIILILGRDLSRRTKRVAERRRIAEEHGLDPFDTERIDALIAKLNSDPEATQPPKKAAD